MPIYAVMFAKKLFLSSYSLDYQHLLLKLLPAAMGQSHRTLSEDTLLIGFSFVSSLSLGHTLFMAVSFIYISFLFSKLYEIASKLVDQLVTHLQVHLTQKVGILGLKLLPVNKFL